MSKTVDSINLSPGSVHLDRIGTAQAPVLVIEGLDPDPDGLVNAAAAIPSFGLRPPYYPGIRAPAPREYAARLMNRLAEPIARAFGWQGIGLIEANFSLVTTPAEALVPIQRIPHIDGTNPDELAVLHYLCGPELGGTSFYRHRSTQFEIITPQNLETWMGAVNREVGERGMPPAQYVDGDTPLFERIARYEAQYNRALVYRGTSLHSGNIPRAFVPDANPRTGRLTVNTFLRRTA